MQDTLDVRQPQPFQLKPFILPGSETVRLNEAVLDTTAYQLVYTSGKLQLLTSEVDSSATLYVQYRTLPFTFREAYYKRKFTPVSDDSVRLVGILLETQQPQQAYDFFGDTKLERSGSITRGVIAGNNRDVSLESGLRIQLAGEVSEGVNVRAVLTDESTPIQPDGSTQRLNEFDRVFIQLEAQQGTATLGDYDLRFAGTEFAPFNRKLQGVSLLGKVPNMGGGLLGGGTVTVAGATSRGIFNVQEVQALDGVQGPYRLEGREGEQFIIVIAGSEKVYIDGVLMTRGETNDYVVDYATGEVTFTSKRLITEDTRVSVEFEYTTNRFTRTLVGGQTHLKFWEKEPGYARLRLGATILREADSRAFNEELGINATDSLTIVNAGDNLASSTGERPVRFDPEAAFVQYVKRDTLFNGTSFTIFVPVTDTARVDTVFQVRFTRVTQRTGDYQRVGRSVNGILFEWVGPNNGDYVAQRLLPKPKFQRLVDFNGVFEPIKGVEVFGEWAQSINDLNRLSEIDSQDDIDDAYLAGARLKPTGISWGDRALGTVSAEFRKRATGSFFEAFGRTRPIEFGRQWNLSRPTSATGNSQDQSEVITEAFTQWDATANTRLRAEWGQLDLDDGVFSGARWGLDLASQEAGLPRMAYQLTSIESLDRLEGIDGQWFRQRGQVSQTFMEGKLVPQFELEHEDRRQRMLEGGGLGFGSFSFLEWRPGASLTLEKIKATGTLEYRTEKGNLEGGLQDRSKAWTGQVQLELRPHKNFTSSADVGYRVKKFEEAFRARGEQDGESIAVRWTGRFSPLKRAVQTTWFYEALTEKTPILQENFVRVGPEIGEYIWIDDNEDGIRQIDEFQLETTPFEGEYVRTFIPSDELEPVINVQARLRLVLNPARWWKRSATGWRGILSKVNSQTTLEVFEKSKEEDLKQIYLLNLNRFQNDSTTVNGRFRIDQRLELFKGESRYGVTFIFNTLESLSRLSAGNEGRLQKVWRFEGRYRPASVVGFGLAGALQLNESRSSQFASRRFNIETQTLTPSVTVNLMQSLQIGLQLGYSRKTDTREDGAEMRGATILKTPLEVRYNWARKLQITARAERASVTLDGEATGLAAFELTDGRGPGVSYLWNVATQYTINQLIRSSFFYDGRAPADAPVIHTLRLQFSLVF